MGDLLTMVYKTGFRGGVEIATESCFGGNLCYKAKEWYEKNIKELKEGEEKGDRFYVSVSSTAGRYLKATWGKYRRMKGRTGEGVIIDVAKRHQCLYEQKFGMTDFRSRSLRETTNKVAMQAIREWYPNKRIG
jgi:hypothetical protein